MNPVLLVANNNKGIKKFLKQFKEQQEIDEVNVFEIEPQNKEVSIDQIREIKKQVSYSFSQPRLFVLYQFDSASYQAQNALLKTLEEHNINIHFVLIVQTLYDILPTIRSRCKIIDVKDIEDISIVEAPIKEGMEKLAAGKSNQSLSDPVFNVSNTSDALKLIDQLVIFFRTRFEQDINAPHAVKTLLTTRSLILRNNVNPQFAIDHFLIDLQKKYSRRTAA